jgi:glycosyltransferase involved in cell wall biosynthesis
MLFQQPPTLSVCLTCWSGDVHLLNECLNHFKNQTRAPDEIIVSSSDLPNPPNKAYGYKYDELIINNILVPIKFVNRTRRGLHGFPRNQGADNCSNDFIMFFDVDDYPHPQKIETTKHLLDTYSPDAIVHNYTLDNTDFIQSDTHVGFRVTEKDRGSTNLISKDGIHHGHLTIRPEIVRKIRYNENRTLGEDGEFCQAVFDAKYNIFYCPEKLVCYNTIRR